MKTHKIVAIDFFCGAGGLTRGLANSGIDVRLGIEIDEHCKRTYENNNSGSSMLNKDVRQVSIREINKYLGSAESDRLLLAACAPCQPFSQLPRKKHDYSEKNLITEFGKFVRKLKPKYVFIENVPGIRRVGKASSFNRFLKILNTEGYKWKESILNVMDYGVPQSRKRLVVFAGRGFSPDIPKPTHGVEKGLKPYITVKDTIKKYPSLKAGETHSEVPNHWSAALSSRNLLRMKWTPKNGGGRLDWPSYLRLKCHKKKNDGEQYKGHPDVYGRMWWNRPAPTLTCKCISLSNCCYGHPSQNRAISLREAAKLQTFPDNYIFIGPSRGHEAQQVGNAVPVKLGEVVGRYFMSVHRKLLRRN